MNKPNMRPVQETNMGIYVWEMPDGQGWIADEDHNFLSVPAIQGSRRAIAIISRAAAEYVGEGVGRPLFLPGQRQITDEEYEHQLARQAAGLVPDPLDYRAAEEEARMNAGHR